MLLEKGDGRLTVLGLGLLCSVHVRLSTTMQSYVLSQITRDELVRIKKTNSNVLGNPIYFCHDESRITNIEVWPAPAEDMEIVIRYYPAMKEV